MIKKKLGVMVGIPTMTNRVSIQIVGFLDALRHSARQDDVDMDVHFTIEVGKTPVEYARNVICGAFLRSQCDKLWFIDEDMMPEATCARLLHSDADIVAARMYKFDHPNPDIGMSVGLGLCAMTRMPNGLYRQVNPEIGSAAIQDCDAVGTGCTVIARRVLEDRRLWSDNVYTTVEGQMVDGNVMPPEGEFSPAIFRYPRTPSGKGLMGEDVDFCERAKALGYSIKVDLNAVCGHFKSIDIDQAGYLAQETVKHVIAGIRMSDGSVLKVDGEGVIKRVDDPPVDKAVHAGDFSMKAL